MKNIHIHKITQHFLSGSCLFTGIALCILGAEGTLRSQLTGQGSDITQKAAGELALVQGHSAAYLEAAQTAYAIPIIIGMLVVLMGLGIHAYFRVSQNSKSPSGRALNRRNADILEVFHLEIWS